MGFFLKMVLQNPGLNSKLQVFHSCQQPNQSGRHCAFKISIVPLGCPLSCSSSTMSLSQPSRIEKSEKRRVLSMSMLQDKTVAESKPTPVFHLFPVYLLFLSPVGLWCRPQCLFFIFSPYCWFREKAVIFLTFSEWFTEDLSPLGARTQGEQTGSNHTITLF